jgi:site-specific DNA-methyltransferase (adenine-specific)
MTPYFEAGDIQIYHGDAREVLSSFDIEATACVTDPPYGLAFMGRSWDDFEPREYQDWCMEWGEIVMDALLPGAPVLAFSGTRNAHRLTCGLEDAGLVIRDRLAWMYGSGFPKSHDISKAIDDARGAEREVVGKKGESGGGRSRMGGTPEGGRSQDTLPGEYYETAPATDEAETWDGYGTALAPSHEPITLAMKPKDDTFAGNALEHGVSGLNIDAARVETDEELSGGSRRLGDGVKYGKINKENKGDDGYDQHEKGRWPANVVLGEAAAKLLDRQSGVQKSGTAVNRNREQGKDITNNCYGDDITHSGRDEGDEDTGGASRFFYTAKASKSDRNAGLPPGEENDHPTVKPTDLMGWLLRLVEMPERNLILDPFCGSGTTLYVAQQMGLPAIGIDQDEESCELTSKRLSEPSLFS